MEYSHLDFIESVEALATFIGIDVLYQQGHSNTPKKADNLKALYALLATTAQFYNQQLKSNSNAQQAIEYLKSRGVNGLIARDFSLGYAPDAWDELKKRFDHKLLLDSGLLSQKDNQHCYDRFRGRLMFPIRDKRGRVVGFGARVLDQTLPKYLNSPETAVFSKSDEVYGLYELLQQNSRPERILIVEGYMDVIALAQFGIHYVVATLGTVTSQKHLETLFRFSTELVFCFDGDKAGKEAIWRAIDMAMPLLKDGRQIKIIALPANEDPDSFIRQQGLEIFLKQIISAPALSDYFFNYLTQNVNLNTVEGRSQLVTQAQPYLQQLPQGIFKEIMVNRLQNLANLSTLSMLTPLKKPSANRAVKRKTNLSLARFTLALLLQQPRLAEIIYQIPDWDQWDFPGSALLKNILQTISANQPANMGGLLEYYRHTDNEKIINTLAAYELTLEATSQAMTAQIITDAINKLVKQAKDSHLNDLLAKANNDCLNKQEKQSLINLLKTS
jgi:DNA primase